MANNARLPSHSSVHQFADLQQLYAELIQHIQPHSTLLLALSGGVDSVVLLHQLYRLREQIPFQLHAMHVHHGLSPNANQWAAHCQWLCQQYKVPLTIQRVNVAPNGSGLESAARQARYQALFEYQYQGALPDWVVTAHHQADQAETFLLQLFRGAGVKGLSAMPSVSDKRLLRPMLKISKSEVLAYATQHQLVWCEDESNQQLKFDRNFIRRQLTPMLKTRYPNVEETLAKSAKQMAEAQLLLSELAQQDATGFIESNRLNIVGLSGLSDSRFNNVLRFWLSMLQVDMPSSNRLSEISKQLRYAKSDASISIKHQAHVLLRYDGFAYCYHAQSLLNPIAFKVPWKGESTLTLPNGCIVRFVHVIGRGIALKHLNEPLLVQSRTGGERFQLKSNRPAKPLKQWFQEANIPPWEREVTPLFTLADKIVFIPGVGIDDDYAAIAMEPGLEIDVNFVK